MKPELLNILICPACGGTYRQEPDRLICAACQAVVQLQDGIPIFSIVPMDITPSGKRLRGLQVDTPWRAANTRFLRGQADQIAAQSIVLDVGAGRGDFAGLFSRHHYLAMDIYPYPEVDLVCDLTQINPIASASVDVILLMNMLEHIPNGAGFLKTISGLLHPGGKIIVTVPFLVKIHQAPYDFTRYTHYHLLQMGKQAGLEVEFLEGYYDPAFLLGESERYIRFWVLPKYGTIRRRLLAVALVGLRLIQSMLAPLLGSGYTRDPLSENNPSPVGYHVIYRRPERAG